MRLFLDFLLIDLRFHKNYNGIISFCAEVKTSGEPQN